jgi:hypothetical protein
VKCHNVPPPSTTKKKSLKKEDLHIKVEENQVLWTIPIIPASREVETGGSQFKASPGKMSETLPQKHGAILLSSQILGRWK